MKRIIVAIAMFIALLIPVPAQADTCVDDLINLGTGICIPGGPTLPPLLPILDPPLIRRPAPEPTTQAPAPVTQAPQPPRASQPAQQPAQPAPKKSVAPKAQPKSGSVTQAPKTSEPDANKPFVAPSEIPRPRPGEPVASEETAEASLDPKSEDKCVIIEEPGAINISVGYTTATVAGIVAIAVCASFLIFYRRRP